MRLLRSVRCDTCGKVYDKKRSLNSHISDTHEQKQYACEICKKIFTRGFVLKTHILAKHSNGKKLFKCEVCPCAYKGKLALMNHVRKPHTENTENLSKNTVKYISSYIQTQTGHFECLTCKKSFKSDFEIVSHLKSEHMEHRKVQMHECDICKKIIRKDRLMKHVEVVHDRILQYK